MADNPQPTLLGKAVADKRGHRTFREVAGEIEQDASTIYHVENGRIPTAPIFLALCRWLKVIPEATYQKLMKYATNDDKRRTKQ